MSTKSIWSAPVLAAVFVILAACSGKDDVSAVDSSVRAEDSNAAGDSVAVDTTADGKEVQPEACPAAMALEDYSTDVDETFDLGPYLMNPTPSSMVIMWRTETPAGGTINYGTDEDKLDQTVSQDVDTLVHKLTLAGLEAATLYLYQVESEGKTSSVLSFRTAPKPGTPFRLGVFGDNKNGVEKFTEEVPRILADGPQIVLGLGDHVKDGQSEPQQWKDYFFEPGRALLQKVPVFAVMGNHEQSADSFYDLYSFPNPYDDPRHESYYSFTYGNAFVVAIDMYQFPCPFGDVDTPHSAWLKEVVSSPEASAATWRIAMSHEPGWSESWSPGNCAYEGTTCVREGILPMLAENDFHLYLAGHTHNYERGMVDDVVQIISGGGGSTLDEWCVDLPTVSVVQCVFHHLRIDAGCDTMRIEAVGEDSQVFDWVEITAGEPGQIVDEGPIPDLPAPPINSDSSEERYP